MIVVRYAVCSERGQKPLTRAVVDNRAEAERQVERYRREDGHDSETAYWIAELGPECEAWRWLARSKGDKQADKQAEKQAEKLVDKQGEKQADKQGDEAAPE